MLEPMQLFPSSPRQLPPPIDVPPRGTILTPEEHASMRTHEMSVFNATNPEARQRVLSGLTNVTLVGLLGSDAFEVRESAQDAILARGERARPAVLAALNHRNAEVRGRAADILPQLEMRSPPALLQRLAGPLPIHERAIGELQHTLARGRTQDPDIQELFETFSLDISAHRLQMQMLAKVAYNLHETGVGKNARGLGKLAQDLLACSPNIGKIYHALESEAVARGELIGPGSRIPVIEAFLTRLTARAAAGGPDGDRARQGLLSAGAYSDLPMEFVARLLRDAPANGQGLQNRASLEPLPRNLRQHTESLRMSREMSDTRQSFRGLLR